MPVELKLGTSRVHRADSFVPLSQERNAIAKKTGTGNGFEHETIVFKNQVLVSVHLLYVSGAD